MTHLPEHWIQKLCVLLSIPGWLNGVYPHQVMRLFTAWQQAEGGTAEFDPLNTTDHVTDSSGAWQGTDYNGVHVANYTTPFHGIVATAATLLNGNYDQLVAALRTVETTGITAEQLVEQHEAELRTWGTSPSLILDVLATTP